MLVTVDFRGVSYAFGRTGWDAAATYGGHVTVGDRP